MKIGILGTGDVGRVLGTAFHALGHEVRMGSRSSDNHDMRAWVTATGERASGGTFREAATFGDLIVLATLGVANEEVLRSAGPGNFRGKIVVDTTNPLDHSGEGPPRLAYGHSDSAGERVQRLLPQARVVKAFNTAGSPLMFHPKVRGGPPDMPICGDDEAAKREVARILREFGWNPIDLGGIEMSRHLEPMCIVWVAHGLRRGAWDHAYKFLTR